MTEMLDRTLEAPAHYAGGVCAWPQSRSIDEVRRLARCRGAAIGREAAAAFEVRCWSW